jgi:hypothetical protein
MKRAKMATALKPGVCLALVLLASCWVPMPGLAGEKKAKPYAVIAGTVFDGNYRAVPGIKVKIALLKGEQRGKTWEHISDRRGEFAQRVPAGAADYLVWAELKPVKGTVQTPRPEAKVHIQNDERQDVGLHLTP